MKAPAHLGVLLGALADPRSVAALSSTQWDRLLRLARSARLLGTLAARMPEDLRAGCPAVAQRHFRAALIDASFRRQKTRFLLACIAPVVSSAAPSCVVLKGAAYVLQSARWAQGRAPADVDIMVARESLDRVEAGLQAAGWAAEKADPYDQNYYRKWSHELPPMTCAGHALELDVHHGILPPLGRLRPDPALLFADAVPIDGTPFKALGSADQLLHVAAHLFQDSDCSNRLRDLVDFDGLLRAQSAAASSAGGLAGRLAERAAALDLAAPLYRAARFADAWLATPAAAAVADAAGRRSRSTQSKLVFLLTTRTLGPPDPDRRPPPARRWAARLLAARAAWLRLPPPLFAYHAVMKWLRSLRTAPADAAEDPGFR